MLILLKSRQHKLSDEQVEREAHVPLRLKKAGPHNSEGLQGLPCKGLHSLAA